MRPSSLLIWAVAAFAGHVAADPFEIDVVETDEIRLLYIDPFQTHLVPHVVRNFHNSIEFQKEIFDWRPNEKPTVVLTDFSDYGNAGAGSTPFNIVSISIAPLSRTLETMLSSEQVFMLMNHELVHIANVDVANSADYRWRKFFAGKPRSTDKHPETILYNYLTVPRHVTPRWFLEGAAVFMETWMAGGIGRAQGAYDEMVFRSMVRDDAYFYSNLGLVSEGSSVDFQTGVNAYLYGTRFISYLAYTRSPQAVIEWLKRGESSERYYAAQFEHVFGTPLESAWQDWIAFEHEFQQRNLASIRKHPTTTARPLVPQALGSISRAFVDESRQELIGAFRFPGVVAHIGGLSMATGKVRRITDIKGPMTYRVSSTAWDPASRRLFYTTDNYEYRDLVAVNVDSGRKERLLKDARIGDIVFSAHDRSIWGLRHLNGYVSLVRIPYPYKDWQLVYTWPYGEVAYELDVSPDGKFVSLSLGEIDGSQHLKVYRIEDLAEEDADAVASYEFTPAVPEGFVFSGDGMHLFGSSFITGVSNILRFDIATQELEAVTNAETGFFRPIPTADGSLVVFEFTGQGFVPSVIDNPVPLDDVSAIRFLGAEIAKEHPVVKEWNVVQSLREVNFDELNVVHGKYRPSRELTLESAYPIIEGYRNSVAPGYAVGFADPLLINKLTLSASYSLDGALPGNERFHGAVEYEGIYWTARYTHNRADFYDLFGPTKRARKGDTYSVGYNRSLITDDPIKLDLAAQLAYYSGLDALPGNQNVPTASIDEFATLDLGLHYSHTRKSLGAVDHEKGWRWNLDIETNDTDAETVVRARAGVDFGFTLPWRHSSIWLYSAAGKSDGDRQNPLGNFYFGSFGNNYVDDGEVKRYRQYDSLPGFEIDEVTASDFVKSVAELNLPPVRFREVGTPSFFLSHVRPAIFVAHLLADPGEPFERDLTSAGLQLDLNFTIAHRLPMTLSFGYATGRENGRKLDDEWLISLKIL